MVSHSVSHMGLPIRWEILNVSQIGIAFHGICPPIFIQTWLQQYGRGAFFHSVHCFFSNPICFWSAWCWRAMIPGEIFTNFAKFQGIVSVSDFRFPIRLQELLQAPLCFLRSFCFARIRLDSLGGQVLFHDCLSMIVSRITTFTEDLVICCYQITKTSARGTAPPMRLLHGSPCNFGPLADLAISVFRSEYKTLCLPKSALLAVVGSKDGSWEELACESLCSGTLSSTKIFSSFLQPFCMSEFNRSLRSCLSTRSLDTIAGWLLDTVTG